MVKRKSEDGLEIVKQLRPDDTGWLAELRRARTDPIDLAAGPGEAPGPPSDPPSPQPAPGPQPPASEQLPQPDDEQLSQPDDEQRPRPDGEHAPRPAEGRPRVARPGPPVAAPGAVAAASPDQPPGPDRPAPAQPPGWRGPTPTPPSWSPGGNRPPPPLARPRPAPLSTAPHRGPHDVEASPRPTLHAHERRGTRRPNRRRLRVVLPIVALLCGAAIGLSWGTGAGPTPSAGAPRSDGARPLISPRTDPPRTVIVTSVRDDGDSVRLAWIDPTAGQAQFVVSQIFDDAPARVYAVPPGQNETVITDLDPNATRYCFKVLAVISGPADVAISPVTCIDQQNPP